MMAGSSEFDLEVLPVVSASKLIPEDSDTGCANDRRIDTDGGAALPDETARSSARARKQPRVVPVVIMEKSVLFRAGLEHILSGSRFRVTASCNDIDELSGKAIGEKHCVALISITEELYAVLPQVASLTEHGLRVIVLSERLRTKEVFDAIEAGAQGYLLKNEISPDALLKSLELVCLGGVVIPNGSAKLLKDRAQLDTAHAPENAHTGSAGYQVPPRRDAHRDVLERLSSRERVILEQLTQGASNKQIARVLNIAETTVKVHVKNLLRKIRVNNRTQAAIWAMRNISAALTLALAHLPCSSYAQCANSSLAIL